MKLENTKTIIRLRNYKDIKMIRNYKDKNQKESNLFKI